MPLACESGVWSMLDDAASSAHLPHMPKACPYKFIDYTNSKTPISNRLQYLHG